MTQREAVIPSADGPIVIPIDGSTVTEFANSRDQIPSPTISDLLSSSSLGAAVNIMMVQSLARGLGSLDAQTVVGVTQTLSGGKNFQQDDWFDLATQAKGLGTTLAITTPNFTPVALFDSIGNVYVLAQDPNGTQCWVGVNFGSSQQFMSLDKADRQDVEARAQLVQRFAVAAVKPVTGFGGFFTTSIPYTSQPILRMNTDGSMSLSPGEKFTGVKTTLPGTQFRLVGVSQVVT